MLVRVLVKWERIGWVVGITMWCPCSFSASSSAPTETPARKLSAIETILNFGSNINESKNNTINKTA